MTSVHEGKFIPVHIQNQKKGFYTNKTGKSNTNNKAKKKKSNASSASPPPRNSPSTPHSISGPKRALQADLSNLNSKIDTIINEYHDFNDAKDTDTSVELTSKYQMDSVMDDIADMSNNSQKTLTSLNNDLLTSTENTHSLLGLLEHSESVGEHREALDNCNHAKIYLQETLLKTLKIKVK